MDEYQEILRMSANLRESLSKEDYDALAQAIYFVTGKPIMGTYEERSKGLKDAQAALLRSQIDDIDLGYIKQTINDLFKMRTLYVNSKKKANERQEKGAKR